MEEVSVSAWVATAGVGLSMLVIWLTRGGAHQRREAQERLRPQLVFSHVALAVLGLGLWIAFLVTGDEVLAYVTLGTLAIVAVLGSTSYYIWQKRRLGRIKATSTSWDVPLPVMGSTDMPAEQHFPVAVVILHGVYAVVTVVVVTLIVVGVDSWTALSDALPSMP